MVLITICWFLLVSFGVGSASASGGRGNLGGGVGTSGGSSGGGGGDGVGRVVESGERLEQLEQ